MKFINNISKKKMMKNLDYVAKEEENENFTEEEKKIIKTNIEFLKEIIDKVYEKKEKQKKMEKFFKSDTFIDTMWWCE